MAAPPALLLCLNLFVFGTSAVYRGNPGEFLLGYSQVSLFLMLPLLGLLLALLLPCRFMGRAAGEVYSALLTLLAVMTYIHGNLLRWDTGVLDGTALDVSSHARDLVDLGIWVALAWLAWETRSWLAAQGWKLCAALALFQLIGLSTLPGRSSGFAPTELRPPERLALLSSESNVIHMVLDGFQGSVFEELIESEPALASGFSGFTFFRDALTSSDVTYLSVPASLHGRPFTNDRPISQYLEESFEGDNLYSFLAGQGFAVDVATPVHWNPNSEVFSSYYVIPTPYTENLAPSTALLLFNLSLFRQVPHFLKSAVYRDGTWMFFGALLIGPEQQFAHFAHSAFLRDLKEGLQPGTTGRVYKFIHLLTPHAPLVSTTDCTFAGAETSYSIENFSMQSRCTLLLLKEFLDQLRTLGVYDRSTIVIHGDHGGGVSFPMRDADGGLTTSSDSLRRVWGNPLPLVLVKPHAATGELQVSNRPVALTDIPATVAELVGSAQNPFPGQSMFSGDADAPRIRTFSTSTVHRNDAAAKDSFDIFSTFEISGSIYDLSSWSEEKLSQAPVLGEDDFYRWGTELSFGKQGSFKPFQKTGWAITRSGNITWTVGDEARLVLPLPVPAGPVRMRAMLKPLLVPGKLDRQRVTVIVNGRELASWRLTANQFQSVEQDIPAEYLSAGGETEFRFLLPDASAPASLGTSRDSRRLALAFMSLRFDEVGQPDDEDP